MSAYRDISLRVAVVLAVVLAAALTTSAKAEASFMAKICDDAACLGGGDVIVTDNGAGDASLLAGVIIATGSVGGLTVTINVSQSKPVLPPPSIDLNFTASGSGAAWFYALDTDFTAQVPLVARLDGNIIDGAGTVQATLAGGGDNDGSTMDNPVATGVLSTSSFHADLFHPAATVSPYALTLAVQLTRTGSGTATGDFGATDVPEPASLILVSLGLAGITLCRRKSRV